MLDNKAHKIELYDSKLSGKKKVIKDGQVVAEVEDDFAFSKSFEIGKHSCTIIQHGEKYELRVDNQSFNHMCDLERNKVHFSSSTPTSSSYVSKPGQSNKTDFGIGSNFTTTNTKDEKQGSFFAIKPASSNSNTNINKRFTVDMSSNSNSNGFNNNNNNNYSESKRTVTTKTENNLIDFGGMEPVSNVTVNSNVTVTNPTQSKSNTNTNTFDLLSLDFGAKPTQNQNQNVNKNEINYPQFQNTQFQNTPYNFSVPTQNKNVSNDPLADLFG
jgi:hypothetical protein